MASDELHDDFLLDLIAMAIIVVTIKLSGKRGSEQSACIETGGNSFVRGLWYLDSITESGLITTVHAQ